MTIITHYYVIIISRDRIVYQTSMFKNNTKVSRGEEEINNKQDLFLLFIEETRFWLEDFS